MPFATLSINYATIFDVQNTQDVIGVGGADISQKDDIAVCPSVLAQYFLYNRTTESRGSNFGINRPEYLNYPGGFITTGDKVNTKHSDLHVEKNLYVSLTSNFNTGFDMRNFVVGNTVSRLTNLRRIPSIDSFVNQSREDEVITIGDFKRYHYYPGMIMMWSGSYSDLKEYLPFWRLCAPPDAGADASGVTVPDLLGRFIMGGSYSNYTAKDNFPTPRQGRDFGTPTKIGVTGGLDFVKLVPNNLQIHDHENFIEFTGGYDEVYSVDEGTESPRRPLTFYTDGGSLKPQTPVDHSGGTGAKSDNATDSWATVSKVERSAFDPSTITRSYNKIVLTRPSGGQEDRGGDVEHENRPPYYALAYIIYVGRPR
jgi:hypothetical protein